jgi:hypothetical protein
MKKYEHIKAGDTVVTLEGYLTIKSISEAGLAWADEYIDTDDGEQEFSGELKLTAQDIARRLRDYDGKNHNVILER